MDNYQSNTYSKEEILKYKNIIDEFREEIDESADVDTIMEKYLGEFNSSYEFEALLSNLLEEWEYKIPDWVYIDWDKTWDYSLSQDLEITTHYLFYQ